MNVLKKPFDDLRVRQALNHAVDKQAIVKNIYQSAAIELPGQVPPGTPGYAQTSPYAYDPAKAKQLLASAGYASGFSTTLLSSTFYAKDTELISFLQQQLAAVGVTVKLQQLEWTAYLDLLRLDPRRSPVEMWRNSRGSGDASFGILRTYGCDFFRPNGGNTNGYCNPNLDALAKQGGITVETAKRDDLLAQAQRLLTQEAPSVWLFLPNAIVAHSKKVHDPLLIRGGTFTPTERTWIEP
jgi:glutathione transport system substrate-binding protein